MAKEGHGLEVIIGAAKKDPRFSKMKGGYDEEPEMDDEDEGAADDLDKAFSPSQAAAIRAYGDSCMKAKP